MAAIPPPVLGGASFALFGTVAVVGVQILRRVDFHDERNVIILAISLAMAITPTVYPTIFAEFPEGVRTIINSGITMGSITAILLNLIFNVWGGKSNLVTKVLPTPQRDEVYSIDQVNQMDRERFVAEFGGCSRARPGSPSRRTTPARSRTCTRCGGPSTTPSSRRRPTGRSSSSSRIQISAVCSAATPPRRCYQ